MKTSGINIIFYIIAFIIFYVLPRITKAKKKNDANKSKSPSRRSTSGDLSPTLKDILKKFDIEIPELKTPTRPQTKPIVETNSYPKETADEMEWDHKYHEQEANEEFEVDLLGQRVQKKEYFSFDNETIDYNEAKDSRNKIHKHVHTEDQHYAKTVSNSIFDEDELDDYDWQKAIVLSEVLYTKKWDN